MKTIEEEFPPEREILHSWELEEKYEALRSRAVELERENRTLEVKLAVAKHQHQVCPDCRDKVREEPCLRCQVQQLVRRISKYEPRPLPPAPDTHQTTA